MADGSSRAIEQLTIGDRLRTSEGDSAIVLIEKPPRGSRKLTQINGLPVHASAGHPFRLAGKVGPRRAALEPWTLIDATPSTAGAGVATLREGTVLAGLRVAVATEALAVPVTRLTESVAAEGSEEVVYDLLLEQHAHCFYVGGPDVYLAVDNESVDPRFHTACTRAIVSAMNASVSHVRQHIGSPATELAAVVNRVELSSAFFARPAPIAPATAVGDCRYLPGPQYYQIDGEWEPHASILEICLVRRFGRWFRRLSAQGWQLEDEAEPSHRRLLARLFDLELLGDVPIEPGELITFTISRRPPAGDGIGDPGVTNLGSSSASVIPRPGRRWHPMIDVECDLGEVSPGNSVELDISITAGDRPLGRAVRWIEVAASDRPGQELFVFDRKGGVIGRVALALRRANPERLPRTTGVPRGAEIHRARKASAEAGRRLGHALMAQIGRPA